MPTRMFDCKNATNEINKKMIKDEDENDDKKLT